MSAIVESVKETFEKVTGCRIYRNSMPHGADFFFDIERRFGRDTIKTIFDVGANVGQSALNYLDEAPKAEIYSFEPVFSTYQKLVDATKVSPRIHPHNCGMGRTAGETVINVNPMSVISSIAKKRPDDHEEIIQLETVSGFAKKQQIQEIDFLKIDTEGFDLEVLAGTVPLLQEQRVHFIQCECEPAVRTKQFVSFPVLAEYLAEYGYRVFGVYEQQPEWDGRNVLRYWNVVFICEKLI